MRTPMIAAAALLAAAPAAQAAAPEWVGSYVYEEPLGPNLSGTVQNFVSHKLVLTAVRCNLSAQGLQTDETIRCSVHPTGNALQVRFVSYADGRTVNKYGTRVYTPGQPLFTLSRSDGKLMTRWNAYRVSLKAKPPGVYFAKV